MNIEFEKYKDEIKDAIDNQLKENPLVPKEGYYIIEGFINQPIQTKLNGSLYVYGPAIPMVAIVGKDTGRMYFFALKILLPKIEY